MGAELKFPLVEADGRAGSYDTVCELWEYLQGLNWQPLRDKMTGRIIGASKPGPMNDTVAGCETGFCKTEFSLAHAANLFELQNALSELLDELRPFCERNNVRFLCYGIQPVTPPNKNLVMKKGRTSPWAKVFDSNRYVPAEHGNDSHLFTINAASHTHISVSLNEIIDAVNVLNGFAGAQIALTANSNIWRGRLDNSYKCVAEKFWDWWIPDGNRVGIPDRPFNDIRDYVSTVAQLRPVFAMRDGKPIILRTYGSFDEYYNSEKAVGIDPQGRRTELVPKQRDIDLHNSCYWYNARISRYFTVENRANDQQPPGELLCISALTLGLVSALAEATEEISSYRWETLRAMRETACRNGVKGRTGELTVATLAQRMLEIAREGLLKRGLGEEMFLEPLQRRVVELRCPADTAGEMFRRGGTEKLIDEWTI